ncbi:MAG: polysaccharide pyruvyl transferase family protein [Cellvibrionaceae bacterium]|nr:polysaccharide pyruvyl transferase family protein [Cellvibrionaceae bacterium]
MTETLSEKHLKIGVFGAYGFGNMGDALLAEASIAGMRRYLPNAEFIGVCQQPENAKKRHGIEALSIYRQFISPSDNSGTKPQNHDQRPASQCEDDRNNTTLFKKVADLLKTIPPLFKFLKLVRDILKSFIAIIREIPFTLSILNNLKQFDLLVISGSGLFTEEWGGPWGFPFALFRWSLLARLAGCKLAYMSVGGGRFKHPLTQFFCKSAINFAHYRTVRDHNTYRCLSAWGARDLSVVPDIAFSAELPTNAAAEQPSTPTVCINPISYCDPRSWNIADAERYENYTNKLAETGKQLLQKGYALHFVPNNITMDNPTIDDIINKIGLSPQNQHLVSRSEVKNVGDVFQGIGGCDFVISSRFHGVVFSLMQSKPVIALAHQYKYSEVLKDMEQERYCLDIEAFQVPELLDLFDDLQAQEQRLSEIIGSHAADFKKQTEQQFRKVASLALD